MPVEPLVAREAELARLRDAAARAATGGGGTLLVHGDAGVGKTALIALALSQTSLHVLVAPPFRRGSPPLWPLARAFGLAEAPDAAALGAAAERLYARQATALVVDDLHLAGAGAFDAILHLADVALGTPLLVIAAWRSDEPSAGGLRALRRELLRRDPRCEIALAPLPAEAVGELAGRLLGARLAPRLVARLVEASGGIPAYVSDLAETIDDRVIEDHEGIGDLRDEEPLPIAATLRETIESRLERLTPEVRAALEIVAILAPNTRLACVLEMIDGDALDGAIASRLVDLAADSVVARTPLVGAALLASIPPGRLRRRQRELALALAPIARAALADERFGDSASGARAALALAPDNERRGLLLVLATAAEREGSHAEAMAAWREAAGLAEAHEDLAAAAESYRHVASVAALEGDAEAEVSASLSAARCYAAVGQPGSAAACRLAGGRRLHLAGALHAALEAARTSGSEAAAAGRLDLEARAAIVEGLALAKLGEGRQGAARVQDALALALDATLADVAADAYAALAVVAEATSAYHAAANAYREASSFCEANGAIDAERICRACLAHVLHVTGSWGQAERLAREILTDPSADRISRCVTGIVLAHLGVCRGAVRDAARLLPAATEEARRLGVFGAEADALWALARRADLDGDQQTALGACRELVDRHALTDDRHYAVRALSWASGRLARGGDESTLHRCANALTTAATDATNPESLAARARALGEIAWLAGQHDDAVTHLVRAHDLSSQSATPLDRAEIGLRAGSLLLATGERERGLTAVRGAYRTARRLGARPLADAAASALQTAGEPTQRRGHPLGATLSAREIEVLRLVAGGSTNREVASTLFLSPRTVDMHVRRILDRLGCRSRTEAATRAATLGLIR